MASASAVTCVRRLVDQYRRFLKTSYRFLDPDLRSQFEQHLAQADVVVRGPYVTLSRDFEAARTLQELVDQGLADERILQAHWPFGTSRLHRHQEEAFLTGRDRHSFVVTTGTGSGKTEAFLLPVLEGVLRRKREGVKGTQAVLLYPMNALANDQLERLRRLLRGSGLPISFSLYTGDSEQSAANLREEPAELEMTSRELIRRTPPDILLTNYKQLEFLLVRKEDRVLFTPALRYLVLDELHSYRGALATEIACLIRRLKAHAGLGAGELVGIGTSATVASGSGGSKALANFASILFGETFDEENVISEHIVPHREHGEPYDPLPPSLSDEDVDSLDTSNESAVTAFAEKLTGRRCTAEGPLAARIARALDGNSIVRVLEKRFSTPADLAQAVNALREGVPGRAGLREDALRREAEAYLLLGSIGDEADPPRLRPKLHSFFHGVYDVALCLNPLCRTLVPHGGNSCPKCHSAARPAALCRTCGQDFVKVRKENPDDSITIGTGDFFSDENVLFLTPKIHALAGVDVEDDDGASGEPDSARVRSRNSEAEGRMEAVFLCTACGRVFPGGGACVACHHPLVPYLQHQGKLNTCPACRDTYTRGDIVTPLRTGTASTVSTLITHHLDHLEKEDRKILVFADNRQDVAHQAGYSADKHRTFALRHVVANEVFRASEGGIYVSQLPEIIFDRYRQDLGIIRGKPSRPEREEWTHAITYELASEFTRYSRQRASLENLGLVAVEYEGIEDLAHDSLFVEACRAAGIETQTGITLVRAVLDVMRRKRAVDFKFFQEYVDPGKKAEYRRLEAEPYNVRFTDRDLSPKGFALGRPDHLRKAKGDSVLGFFQENQKSGAFTAAQRLAMKVIPGREASQAFLEAVVPRLIEPAQLLVSVPEFPLPKAARDRTVSILQISRRFIRLVRPAQGFRCNACQLFRPYEFPACPTPGCRQGRLQPEVVDEDNYYRRLYTDRPPLRLDIKEHSAQIQGQERAKRESAFKDGKLDALVCTPTLELGVDIGPLLTVALRGAPPTPANYVQRVGRAGRRLRIGFVSTFCAGGPHDMHAFQDPSWLVSGNFAPPLIRLDNPRIVNRHLRSYLLALTNASLPRLMGEMLDDPRVPTAPRTEALEPIYAEVRAHRESLTNQLSEIFKGDRAMSRAQHFSHEDCAALVESFEGDLKRVMDRWFQRVRQLDREFHAYSTVGSPVRDMKKAAARQRAFREITNDPERAYVLNYLSVQGLLPAYQFPVETFSLDPGVDDTPTLYRPSAIAIEEFAPGNFVYANGHKLKSIRALYAGGPGARGDQPARSDAESSGRLRTIQFCGQCDEATEEARNTCQRCSAPLDARVGCLFADAFEAEENLRIGSDEESRQRQYFDRRVTLLPQEGGECDLYDYPFAPIEYRRLASLLMTNWGRVTSKSAHGAKFSLCPDCGRHQPASTGKPAQDRATKAWLENHSRICRGTPEDLVLAHEFQADALVLTVAGAADEQKVGRFRLSPMLVTLAESLLMGAAGLLELEPFEIGAFPRQSGSSPSAGQIVLYETVPGGAGYVEEMVRRLPEVAEAARKRLFGHECLKGCYLCLKHYRNQQWHALFDKNLVRGFLLALTTMDHVDPTRARAGSGEPRLLAALAQRVAEFSGARRAPGTKGPESPIEAALLAAIRGVPGCPEPEAQHEIKRDGRLFTIPDFAYPEQKITIYCDGFAFHGNKETLELDAQKRNWLQSKEGGAWIVLTYWGRTIMRNAEACAKEIAQLHRQRVNIQ